MFPGADQIDTQSPARHTVVDMLTAPTMEGERQSGTPVTDIPDDEKQGPVWDVVTGVISYLWQRVPEVRIFAEGSTWVTMATEADRMSILSLGD